MPPVNQNWLGQECVECHLLQKGIDVRIWLQLVHYAVCADGNEIMFDILSERAAVLALQASKGIFARHYIVKVPIFLTLLLRWPTE